MGSCMSHHQRISAIIPLEKGTLLMNRSYKIMFATIVMNLFYYFLEINYSA